MERRIRPAAASPAWRSCCSQSLRRFCWCCWWTVAREPAADRGPLGVGTGRPGRMGRRPCPGAASRRPGRAQAGRDGRPAKQASSTRPSKPSWRRSGLEAQRTEITRERQLRLRTERARQAEREWSRELRDQVVNMYRSRGPSGDLHELVLEMPFSSPAPRSGMLLVSARRRRRRPARPRLPPRLRHDPADQLAGPALRRPCDRAGRDRPRGRPR